MNPGREDARISHRQGSRRAPGRRRPPLDPMEVARRKDLEHRKLRRMIGYAETSGCLRATILRYSAIDRNESHADLQQLCPADRRRRRTAPPRAQDSVRHRARRERYGKPRSPQCSSGISTSFRQTDPIDDDGTSAQRGAAGRGTSARRRCGAGLVRVSNDQYSYAEPDSPGARGDGRARSADCAHCADHTERSDVADRPPEEAPASP